MIERMRWEYDRESEMVSDKIVDSEKEHLYSW